MSDFKKDDSKIIIDGKDYNWSDIWDAHYYDFIRRNKKIFKKNYALANSVNNWQRKSDSDKENIIYVVKHYK